MDHNAIYKEVDTVVRISDSQGAFDADGNSVEIDQALVDAARSELDVENAWSDLRAKRDQLLVATDWEIIKHKVQSNNDSCCAKNVQTGAARLASQHFRSC